MNHNLRIGDRVFVAENATLLGDVTIGDGSGIWFGAVLRGDRDRIVVGAGSNVQDNATVHVSAGHPAIIGDRVSIGHGAIVHGCTISDDVLVGMGAIVMNGSVVGEGSIIGAGAVVTEGRVVPPGSLVLGVPGKVVREVTGAERESILENARVYMDLAGGYLGE
ncbi:gamma carbonic anhydrase family protein [Methanofollis fontis]|uniref:Gamma carbonic anhydrase family protein n=1 Tax=Methanofollis fontis TaxID=2052832 RepID=A0A483CSW1_9EURY|nr:gamma carbonic anhydrase family protein [Methanofollis fontis]TAJ43653.1 gamma carbonic anhydrase family protein [Methanofollis fontis]